MNYLSDDNSLILKSTFDSPSSTSLFKRQMCYYFQGGEGVVIDNNGPELRSSAGFSTIDIETLNLLIPWHATFHEQPGFIYFGRMFLAQRTDVDVAFLEKLEESFKLNLMIRIGNHLCKTGHDTLTTCGEVELLVTSRRSFIKTKWCIRHFSSCGYGICTHTYGGQKMAITPLRRITNGLFVENILFINVDNMGLVP
ncbi:9098_t:CDS:2 [Gigaspora margarita]|uniref:9098_t:CDS:1 n=1 Tax=Gigaspora margarita TaxID=4874 RepID=A0ABN7UBU8_GIGMA|nr:9098_t:CDS:2 [Gigaspora margarita]